MLDKSAWLYPENQDFWQSRTGLPINYTEIMTQLRTKYGVSDRGLISRITIASLALVMSLGLVGMACVWISTLLQDFIYGSLDLFLLLISPLVILLSIAMAFYFLRATFNLLAHRQKSVNNSWATLLSDGKLLKGVIMGVETISFFERDLRYEFENPIGKKKKGYYKLSNFSINPPTEVLVWYVNDNLHTLL